MFWREFTTMKAFIIFCVCLSVVASTRVCSQVDVATLLRPCLQIIMQGGGPRSEEEMCRSGTLQKVEECFTDALKECTQDDDFKQLWARTGLEQIKKKSQGCKAKSDVIVDVVASEKVCSEMDVATSIRPCLQIIMQGGIPSSEEELCRSGKVEKVVECYTNALKECKKDGELKRLLEKFGFDQYQEVIANCQAEFGIVASQKVCTQIDVATAVRPCLQVLMEGGLYQTEEQRCRSGNLQKVAECFTNALKECKKDDKFNLMAKQIGLDQFQKKHEECQAKSEEEHVCGPSEIHSRLSPCIEQVMERMVTEPNAKRKCNSILFPGISECAEKELKNCKKNGDFKHSMVEANVIDTDRIKKICFSKNEVEECNPQVVLQCAMGRADELEEVAKQHESGSLDVNAVLNLVCGFRECFAFVEKCSSTLPSNMAPILFVVKDAVDFLCDGEGRQALLDLETCFKEGPLAEFDQCFVDKEETFADDVCDNVSPFEDQINRCAREHLLNSPSCGEQAIQSIQLLTARLSGYIEDICTKVSAYNQVQKRGLALTNVRGIFQTFYEEMRYNHLLRW